MVFELFLFGKGQVLQFASIVWLWFFIILSSVLFVNYLSSELILKKVYRSQVKQASAVGKFSLIVLISFIVSQWMHAEADASFYFPLTKMASIYPLAVPARIDGNKKTNKHFLFSNQIEKIDKIPQSESLENITCSKDQHNYNLLIILIDSMRFDLLTQDVMPHTFEFSQKHLQFTNHFSGSNETRGGVFSLFYGLPPFYFESKRQKQENPQLLNQIKKLDYEKSIQASAPLTKPEFDQTVFAHIDNLRLESISPTASTRDDEIASNMLQFLDHRNTSKPFFGFLFFDSLHAYDFPVNYQKKFEPLWNGINYFELNQNFDPLPFKNRYKTSAHYVDYLLGLIFKKIENLNLMQNTVIIITSDHGQEFNDTKKNYWGHNSNFSPYQTQVPLIMAWPNKEKNIIFYRTTHYDLAPTLMKHLFNCNIEMTKNTWGYDLFSNQDRHGTLMGYSNKFGILLDDKLISSEYLGQFNFFDFNYNEVKPSAEDYQRLDYVLRKMSKQNQVNNSENQ